MVARTKVESCERVREVRRTSNTAASLVDDDGSAGKSASSTGGQRRTEEESHAAAVQPSLPAGAPMAARFGDLRGCCSNRGWSSG